jgi:hypothetical protein
MLALRFSNYQEQAMAAKDKQDREPWSPRIESERLFINSADFERGLAEGSNPPDTDITDEADDVDEEVDSATPNPFIKPAG